MNERTLSTIEAGLFQPRRRTLERLARAVSIDPDELSELIGPF